MGSTESRCQRQHLMPHESFMEARVVPLTSQTHSRRKDVDHPCKSQDLDKNFAMNSLNPDIDTTTRYSATVGILNLWLAGAIY